LRPRVVVSLPSLSSDFFASFSSPRLPSPRPLLPHSDATRLASLPSSNGDATAYLTAPATRLSTDKSITAYAPARMAAPGLDEVMAFLTEHGFASTASALRDDVLGRTAEVASDSSPALDPRLPPLRMPASASASGVGAGTTAPASPGSSSESASSSAFVSMRSTPSGIHRAVISPFFLLWALNPPHLCFRGCRLCPAVSRSVRRQFWEQFHAVGQCNYVSARTNFK
jgi:hypothetical protein